MSETRMPEPATALDHESTIVAVVELSARSWLVGAQVAGVPRQCRQKLAPSAEGLLDHLDQLRQRAEKAGKRVVGWSSPTRRVGTGFGWPGGC